MMSTGVPDPLESCCLPNAAGGKPFARWVGSFFYGCWPSPEQGSLESRFAQCSLQIPYGKVLGPLG